MDGHSDIGIQEAHPPMSSVESTTTTTVTPAPKSAEISTQTSLTLEDIKFLSDEDLKSSTTLQRTLLKQQIMKDDRTANFIQVSQFILNLVLRHVASHHMASCRSA